MRVGGKDSAMDDRLHRPARARSAYVLAVLFAVYVMNMADRQIIGILAESIKRDLQLSDSAIGFLAGPAIAFFYAVLGIPMAYAADRINRVRFVAACLAVWSVMTIAGGRATSLAQLAATRVGVSIGEAGGTPSSVSLIADYFAPARRATAMAIWTSGSTVGIFLGFALGGVINERLGWRDTFVAAGLPGLVLAVLLVLTVREPVRGSADAIPFAADDHPRLSLWPTFAFLWQIAVFRTCCLAVAACNFCVFAVLTWAPPFAVRSFGAGTAEVGTVMGAGIAVVGGTMMVIAGVVSDRLARRGIARPLLAVAAMLVVSAAFFTAAFFATGFRTFAILFTIGYGALMTNPPITWVVVQTTTPPHMRAMATAVLLLTVALLASVPAPLLVGATSDALRATLGGRSLGTALLLAPAALIVASLLFVRLATMSRERPDPVQTSI